MMRKGDENCLAVVPATGHKYLVVITDATTGRRRVSGMFDTLTALFARNEQMHRENRDPVMYRAVRVGREPTRWKMI